MRNPALRRFLKFALIGALLLLVLGVFLWVRLPAMVERRIVQQFAEAGFPETRLRVTSVGLSQLKVSDLAIASRSWRVRLPEGTVRYDPLMLLRSRARSMHLDGLQIDVDLDHLDSGAAGPTIDRHALQDRLDETPARMPLRRIVVADGRLNLHRVGHLVSLPFAADLTNDATTEQIRLAVATANPVSKIEGRLGGRDGVRATAEIRLADGWESWMPLVVPEEWRASVEALPLGTASIALELRSSPESEWVLQGRAAVDEGILAGVNLHLNARVADWTPTGPVFSGGFHARGIKFDQFEPPRQLTGSQRLRISGDLEVTGEFGWNADLGLDIWPDLEMTLGRIEWLDMELTVGGINGVLSGAVSSSSEAAVANLLRVDHVRYKDFEVADLTLRIDRRSRNVFEFELVDALVLGGHCRMPPFRWDTRSDTLEAVLELEQIRLDRLADLLPRFDGSMEGNINGRVPLRLDAGRFSLGASTLRLDRSRPARLRYPADGLLTKGVSPDSDRYEQLELIEEALEDLKLTELVVDLYPPDQPQTPVRLRLEGTFSSPDAIIPVKFNLNLNGDLDEVLSLLSRGEIELTL